MNDKEFERLKMQVAIEEQRRKRLAEKKEMLDKIRNALQPYNGWVIDMNIHINQDYVCTSGADGNGPIGPRETRTLVLKGKDCELFMELFEKTIKEMLKNDNE